MKHLVSNPKPCLNTSFGTLPKQILLFFVVLMASFYTAFAQPTSATLTPKTATCQANGEIAITNVTGGCSPYKYALVAGPGVPLPAAYVTTSTFTGLQAGTFTISILDCNGNEGVFTTTVSGNYQLMNYTLVPTTTCSAGTSTGRVTVTGLTGGNPPYRYKIISPTPTAFQSSGTFTGLNPGNCL